MVNHMKTTIDIADSLLSEIKQIASNRGTTLKAVVESALRKALESEERKPGAFKLRKRSFRGNGLQSGLSETDWAGIRERAYEGRGG